MEPGGWCWTEAAVRVIAAGNEQPRLPLPPRAEAAASMIGLKWRDSRGSTTCRIHRSLRSSAHARKRPQACKGTG
jgi:hypothetical protein